jgi:hypothetical protein
MIATAVHRAGTRGLGDHAELHRRPVRAPRGHLPGDRGEDGAARTVGSRGGAARRPRRRRLVGGAPSSAGSPDRGRARRRRAAGLPRVARLPRRAPRPPRTGVVVGTRQRDRHGAAPWRELPERPVTGDRPGHRGVARPDAHAPVRRRRGRSSRRWLAPPLAGGRRTRRRRPHARAAHRAGRRHHARHAEGGGEAAHRRAGVDRSLHRSAALPHQRRLRWAEHHQVARRALRDRLDRRRPRTTAALARHLRPGSINPALVDAIAAGYREWATLEDEELDRLDGAIVAHWLVLAAWGVAFRGTPPADVLRGLAHERAEAKEVVALARKAFGRP